MKSLYLLFPLLTLLVISPLAVAEDFGCRAQSNEIQLIYLKEGTVLGHYESITQCHEAVEASRDGVICLWFTPDMPLGPGGWAETGWRAMSATRKIGLGRRPLEKWDDCLLTTQNAHGGVICTNTGLGFKPTHTETNEWCGASAQLPYCLKATASAKDHVVCSFPSEGTGAEAGWVKTTITTQCQYEGNKSTVEDCSSEIR